LPADRAGADRTTVGPDRVPATAMSLSRSLVPTVTVLALAASSAAAAGTTYAASAPTAPAVQRLAVLERAHDVFVAPDRDAERRTRVARRRPITGVVTVLPVLREVTGAGGVRWLRVLLPGRPNGASGWITARATRRGTTEWRIRASLASRRVTVFHRGRAVRTFRAVIGARETPTPRGRFFVEENVRLGPSRAGAPYALALSARSGVLQEFDGGPGQIALHGLGGVGGVLGTAASHGCLRLGDRAITWLSRRIVPGTPVTIGA